jgi:hypothetical protein
VEEISNIKVTRDMKNKAGRQDNPGFLNCDKVLFGDIIVPP